MLDLNPHVHTSPNKNDCARWDTIRCYGMEHPLSPSAHPRMHCNILVMVYQCDNLRMLLLRYRSARRVQGMGFFICGRKSLESLEIINVQKLGGDPGILGGNQNRYHNSSKRWSIPLN